MTGSFSGVIPILPTPFTERGEVDDEGFVRAIESSIADGVDGVAMLGLASEYYKLSDSERLRLVSHLVQRVGRRVSVIVSVVSHATKLAIAEAAMAVNAGADALMIIPPFFLGPPIEATLQHVRAVASAVQVPIIVQYAPLQTGRPIEPDLFATLHREVPNITHVKVDSVPSGRMIAALHARNLQTLVGYMGLHLPADFRRGCNGVMPTVSLSSAFVKLWQLLSQGNDQEAQLLHDDLLPLLTFMTQSIELLIASEKRLLVRRGILTAAYCREPEYRLDSAELAELEVHCLRLGKWLTPSVPNTGSI